LDTRLGGSQIQSECSGEEERFLPLPGIKLRPSSPWPLHYTDRVIPTHILILFHDYFSNYIGFSPQIWRLGLLVKGQYILGLNQLNSMPWRCVWERRCSSTFFNLDIKWRWVVSFTPRPLHPQGNSPPVHIV
jgi:hypothetical protein